MSVKIPITVLVQTKNEEIGILACIEELHDFDEVIVVDSDSVDETKHIAAKAGAMVINFSWNGRYPKKKQWQLSNLQTSHNWILFMDADEHPSPQLISELRKIQWERLTSTAAFDIQLDYKFAGKILRHGHRVVKRALVHRERVSFPVMDDLGAPGMGELEGHYQPIPIGKVSKLDGRILHDDKDPVRTWFDRHNRYSDWEAYLRGNPGVQAEIASRRSRQGRLFDSIPFKPLVFFLYSYIVRQGFRDGRAGFDYAVALSTYYWQIGLKTREANGKKENAS